ncbi:MAG TPA: hypothetical protein PK082_00370 [Phycisphaerae bacterium]|nr:hypothetical protein [Phycisphaerae bacterium]
MASAKQGNFFERHVEKMVLGVFILVLLYAIGHWAGSSPRTLKVPGGQEVAPEQVDAELLREAQNAKQWKDRQEVPRLVPPDPAEFDALMNQPFGSSVAVTDLGSPVAVIEQKDEAVLPDLRAELASLAQVIPAPDKPRFSAERVLPMVESPEDVALVTVESVYPWGELFKNWSGLLAKVGLPATPIVADVQVQREELLPDGSWGNTTIVQTVRVLTDTQNKSVLVRRDSYVPPVPPFTGENGDAVRQAMAQLSQTAYQQFLLQPEYFYVWWGPKSEWVPWQIYLPKTPVSEAAEAPAEMRTIPGAEVRPVAPSPTPAPPPVRRRVPAPVQDLPSDMGMPPPGYEPPYGPPYGTPRPTAPRPVTPAPVVGPRATAAMEPPTPPAVPDLSKQIENGQVLVWAHDTSIDPRKTYRYRLQVAFLNPLLGLPLKAKTDADARTATVLSPFGPWSNPVSIPKATQMFLTGANPMDGSVKVTIFARSFGQGVQANFTVRRGEPVGGVRKVKVINPVSGVEQEVQVDFSTGAVAADFDFNKPVLKGNFSTTTVEMVYLDEQGRLQSRNSAADESSDTYKKLRDETQRAVMRGPTER